VQRHSAATPVARARKRRRHKDCIWNGSPDGSTVHGPTGQNAHLGGLPFPDGTL